MVRIPIILFLFFVQSLFAQQKLTDFTQKYDPYVKKMNQGLTILTSTAKGLEVASLGKGGFDEHTVFNIGSATKKMTAILLLQEEERGNLKLSDSIGKYLDSVQNVDMSLSIETLLRHRSGLGELVGANVHEFFFTASDSILNQDFLKTIPEGDTAKIGKHDYCNTNYILLGHLLEKVTDQSYFDLLRERIFEPAQMKESYPYISKSIVNLAPPTNGFEDISSHLDFRYFSRFCYSAGCVASTLNDMMKFNQHLLEKNTLISDESRQKLLDFDDADYGLGVMKLKDGFIGHGGNNTGYSYREYYNPESKEMILAFANSFMLPFHKMLREEVVEYLKGENVAATFNNNLTVFTECVGKYLIEEENFTLEIELLEKKDGFYFVAQGVEVILISKEDGKLFAPTYGIELEKIADNSEAMIYRQNGFEITMNRIHE